MDVKSEILEIKFSGEIKPESLSLEELSQELLLFNKLIKPIIEEQFPGELIDNDFVGLLEVGNRSVSFRYALKRNTEVIKKAFGILLIAINTHDISALPARTIDALEKTSDFNGRYAVTSQFGEVVNGQFVSRGSFTNEFKAEKIGEIKGNTVAYGYLKWIGGVNPQAKLVLDDRSEIVVKLSEDQARHCSPYLYSFISVHGVGTWKGLSLKLTSIKAETIEPFENLSPEEGFDFLSKNLGEYLKDTDPNLFN